MFLIGPLKSSFTELETFSKPSAVEPSLLALESLANERIERVLEAFSYNPFPYSVAGYDTSFSSSDPSVNSELLRAAGGATHIHRFARGQLGSKAEIPLLDELGANLLKCLLNRYYPTKRVHSRSSLGSKTSYTHGNLIDRLTSKDAWNSLQRNALGVQRMSFKLSDFGQSERLIFIGYSSRDVGGGIERVLGVEVTGSGKPRSALGALFKDRLNEIFDDYHRRSELSAQYAKAKRAVGVPHRVRSAIAEQLAAVGIEEGSYSELAYGPGSFPYPVTQIPIGDSKAQLHFIRCESCGSVKGLSVEDGTEEQRLASTELSSAELATWHRSICDEQKSLEESPPLSSGLSSKGRELWPVEIERAVSSKRVKPKLRGHGKSKGYSYYDEIYSYIDLFNSYEDSDPKTEYN